MSCTRSVPKPTLPSSGQQRERTLSFMLWFTIQVYFVWTCNCLLHRVFLALVKPLAFKLRICAASYNMRTHQHSFSLGCPRGQCTVPPCEYPSSVLCNIPCSSTDLQRYLSGAWLCGGSVPDAGELVLGEGVSQPHVRTLPGWLRHSWWPDDCTGQVTYSQCWLIQP